jgi:zinc transporter ZupT
MFGEVRRVAGCLLIQGKEVPDAVAPVLRVSVSFVIKPPESILVLSRTFSAGSFLYLGAGDLLPEAHEQNPPLKTAAASLAGFAPIWVVVRLTTG